MSLSRYSTLKQARISNNCPECYSNDSLEITFKQKRTETKFYKAITKEIIAEIHCLNCKLQIFPSRWTDAIDRVVDYHKRAIHTEPNSVQLKSKAWMLIGFGLVLIGLIVLWMTGILSPYSK